MPRSRTRLVAALCAVTALTACTSSSSPAPGKSDSTGSRPASDPHLSQGSSSSPTASRPAAAVKTLTTVTGTATTLHFDPKFVRTLYTHGIATTATGKAKLAAVVGSSNAILPITAGSATIYKAAAKTHLRLQHDSGGLTVSSDAGAVRVSDLAVDLGSKPVITSRLVAVSQGTVSRAQPITLFGLQRTASFRATVANGLVTVSGLRLYLTASAAKAFDKALHTTVFVHGNKVLVGTVTAVVRGH